MNEDTQEPTPSNEEIDATIGKLAHLVPGDINDPLLWAFYGNAWGWEPPNPIQVDTWLAEYETRPEDIRLREITQMSYQNSPAETVSALDSFLNLIRTVRTNDSFLLNSISNESDNSKIRSSTAVRKLQLHIKRLLRRFNFLQDHLPNKEYTFEDLRNCIYSFPPSERRKALDLIIGMLDEGGYIGSLTPMQEDIVRLWPDRLEANSRAELRAFLDSSPNLSVNHETPIIEVKLLKEPEGFIDPSLSQGRIRFRGWEIATAQYDYQKRDDAYFIKRFESIRSLHTLEDASIDVQISEWKEELKYQGIDSGVGGVAYAAKVLDRIEQLERSQRQPRTDIGSPTPITTIEPDKPETVDSRNHPFLAECRQDERFEPGRRYIETHTVAGVIEWKYSLPTLKAFVKIIAPTVDYAAIAKAFVRVTDNGERGPITPSGIRQANESGKASLIASRLATGG